MPVRRPVRFVVALTAALATATATATAAFGAVTGPDVAGYQHPRGDRIDWNRVSASGSSFAFVKATEGTTFTNRYFATDWASLRTAGLARGAYHFARPYADPATAAAQARYFVSVAGTMGDPGELPPVLDLEVSGGLKPSALATWASTWLTTVEKLTGRTPIVYTGPYFWKTAMAASRSFARYPLWIACYCAQPPASVGGWSRWTFWQYTSTASTPGVNTGTDMSMFNGTDEELRALAGVKPTPARPAVTRLRGALALAAAPGGASATGWALDPRSRAALRVAIHVDRREVTTVTAGAYRQDVARAYPRLGGRHGFTRRLPLPPGRHTICATAVGPAGSKTVTSLGCRQVMVAANPVGAVTRIRRSRGRLYVTGWAADPNTAGPVQLRITAGRSAATVLARASSRAAARRLPAWGARHGFTRSLPATTHRRRVCVTAYNIGPGRNRLLHCSTH